MADEGSRPEPFTLVVEVRISQRAHKEALRKANGAGRSLNTYLRTLIEREVLAGLPLRALPGMFHPMDPRSKGVENP